MDDGKIRIDFMNFFRGGLSEGKGIGAGVDHKFGRPSAGAVDVKCRRRVEAELVNIGHYADNRQPAGLRIERAQVDAFADGIGAGPESLRERVIDDYVGTAEVGGREKAAFDERDAHRFEVAEVRAARLCDGAFAGFRDGLAFDEKARSGLKRCGEGKHADATDDFDAGQALNSGGHLLKLN